jgi:hypothetical protein
MHLSTLLLISKYTVPLNRLKTGICYSLTNSIQGWCIANPMQRNSSKTRVISSRRNLKPDFYIQVLLVLCNSAEYRVILDSKLLFHNHISYIFPPCIMSSVLIRSETFSFSSLECLYILRFTVVKSKPENASVIEIRLQILLPRNWNASNR